MVETVEVPYISALQAEKHSFGFERDVTNGQAVPVDQLGLRVFKTGTTIAGLICEDGIVLGADTRATAGGMVAEANAFKLHCIADNIWCAGAGVSADLEHVTMNLKAEITLFSKQVGRMPRVQTVVSRLCQHLNKYQGHIVTALICGGINPTGEAELTYVDPSGYTHSGPFMAMGSGGYFAKTILESMYKDGLTVAEGEKIIAKSVEAGIMNDLASGTQVDVVIIKKSDPTHPVVKKAILEPVKHQKVPIPARRIETQTVVLREERRPITEFQP